MRCLLSVVLLVLVAEVATAQTIYPPPYPVGMRVQVGGSGALPRNTPSINGTCGEPAHPCTVADSALPGTYGVVLADTPVLDPAGWYWLRITFDTMVTGWVSAYPPYLNTLVPPQMIAGVSFYTVGDYNGPTLTAGRCLNDGLQSTGILSLQISGTGQQGTIQCLWDKPPLGNHISVIQAVNANGTTPSAEFQFSVTGVPSPQPPTAPTNVRIAPVSGGALGLK